MADFISWSHSRLSSFKQCPKSFWHQNVAKKGTADRVEYVESAAMRAGTEVDDALTARIAGGVPLPDKFTPYEPIAKMVLEAPGVKFTQLKCALDSAFKECGYLDWDKVWVRCVFDFAIIDGSHALILDWKNGSVYPNEDQLRLFAAVGFCMFPEVEAIDTSYVWLRFGVTSDAHYERRELGEMWNTFIPTVERLQISHRTNHWPATPSKRACKFCGANRQGLCSVAAVPFG